MEPDLEQARRRAKELLRARLIEAALNGRADRVEWLLAHDPALAHDVETTRLLLDRGANPDDGESVYHAVEGEDTACLELLLARGATVRGTNAIGNANNDVRKLRILIEQGDLRPEDPEIRNGLLYARDP